ncbi:thiol:disulfide interchange protein DsbA/DsbL [Pseudomonas lactis]|uniref:Thiol:disulfide interchange protein n=1 Tax=Pseudomonas lactis TaxID=1615674 RepID=I4K973_9PSED|nr:thiol:disulfide interchange protein DsbA/DsbL [Pseudomonas lactis]EIK61263.1 thiol:disulfide interchange protein DsbA [Pseudomonas lactis]
MRHCFLSTVLLSTALLSQGPHAANQYVELPGSVVIKQQGKIQVLEFFSYGCGHCFDLETTIVPWIEQLPEDVDFNRVPAMFGGIWDAHGQLFLTLQAMDVDYGVHNEVFQAIRNRHRLATPAQMADFLELQGIDKYKFLATYHSFAVQARVMDAKQKIAAYNITGVPAMVVDGKYRFDLSAGGSNGILQLADRLIVRGRTAH